MQFIKHFTEAHRGPSLRAIKRELGMAGIGMYWCLVELCGEKMRKEADEEFTEDHCRFEFDVSALSECLGVKSGRVEVILKSFQGHSQLQFERHGFIFKIFMPKLLECLDRDSKRARSGRDESAPKNKIKNKNKSLEEYFKNEAEIWFQAIRKFPSDYQAMQWLGESRKPHIDDIGGLKFVRSLKDNDFEVKRLAGLIKNSWETLKQEKEGA